MTLKGIISKQVLNLWVRIFVRPCFYRMNHFIFNLSIHGLGVLNYISFEQSGEKWLLESYLSTSFGNGEGKIVFDVGANVGTYTKIVMNYFPEAKIYCFEPEPSNYKRLRESANSSNVYCYEFGFSDCAGNAMIYDYADKDEGTGHATMYPEVISNIHRGSPKATSINLRTIDQFCIEHCINRINLLKMDIEGNELKCLKGASQMLKRDAIDYLLFEFNQMNVISRTFMQDFFALLPQHDLYRLLPKGILKLDEHNTLITNLFHFQNIIAIRKQDFAEPTQ